MIIVSCWAWERKTWVSRPLFILEKIRTVNRSTIVEKIEEIAEKVTARESLELVHVELVGAGKQQIVRIFIDKEDGITHDDCSSVSQQIEKQLDEEDPVRGSYTLEVSSPGIERGLYKLADYRRFTGETAKIKTISPIDGQRNFQGEITGVEDEEILFNDKTNGSVRIPFEIVTKANLKADFEEELRRAKRKA